MKLFEVQITKRVFVVAADRDAAVEVAKTREVMEDPMPPEFMAYEILGVPRRRLDERPYGAADNTPERDWTLGQWLDSWGNPPKVPW